MPTTTLTPHQAARAAVDETSWATTVVDFEHHELHSGDAFHASGTVDLAASGTVICLFRTPNTTKWCHVIPVVTSEVETAATWYEGFAVGTAHGGTVGTSVIAKNRNRNSSTAAGATVYSGATVGTASPGTSGSVLQQWHWGSGRDVGGEARGVTEWIGKQNTWYMLEIINQSASAANYVTWQFEWYEHTDNE